MVPALSIFGVNGRMAATLRYTTFSSLFISFKVIERSRWQGRRLIYSPARLIYYTHIPINIGFDCIPLICGFQFVLRRLAVCYDTPRAYPFRHRHASLTQGNSVSDPSAMTPHTLFFCIPPYSNQSPLTISRPHAPPFSRGPHPSRLQRASPESVACSAHQSSLDLINPAFQHANTSVQRQTT
jgi:hypothetical protein